MSSIRQGYMAFGHHDIGAPSKLSKWSTVVVLLQAGHRLGSVALLAMIGTWAMLYTRRDFTTPLAIACGFAGFGLGAALVARMISPTDSPNRREAHGLGIFNLVLFAVALNMVMVARIDQIRWAASEFFAPDRQIDRRIVAPK